MRPPARGRAPPPSGLERLLAALAEGVLLVAEPDGTTAFDIAVRDDVFDDLGCRVAIRDGRLSAVFRVRDTNLRRLLEAETGRLRAALAARGLVLDDVLVTEE